MSVTYGFYNSLNGDRKYDSAQISSIFDGLIVDGIFASIGTVNINIRCEMIHMSCCKGCRRIDCKCWHWTGVV